MRVVRVLALEVGRGLQGQEQVLYVSVGASYAAKNRGIPTLRAIQDREDVWPQVFLLRASHPPRSRNETGIDATPDASSLPSGTNVGVSLEASSRADRCRTTFNPVDVPNTT